MKLEISNWSILKKLYPELVLTKAILRELIERHFFEYNFSSLGIIFVSEEYIHRLNKQYRGVDSVTDVLSFNLSLEPLIGEVYLCPEYILRNFSNKKFQEEILRDIIHGILHISGFDHIGEFSEKNKKEEMFVKQEDILQNILNEINNRTGQPR